MPNINRLFTGCLLTGISAFGYQTGALADDADQFTGTQYDGSQFKATSFKDSSLDKQNFGEAVAKTNRTAKKFDSEVENLQPGKCADDGITLGDDEDKARDRAAFIKEEKFNPVHEITGDWVPSKIDLTSNGGFTNSPFNGSPVPYNLNGHVDAERGTP